MCVLEKLMNKSLGVDYDWCVRNKRATIGCCRIQRGVQTNCRWTNCWIKQTAHPFHHMCIVFLMTDYSYVVCSLNMLFFAVPRGISHWMRQWSSGSLHRELMYCFPKSHILGAKVVISSLMEDKVVITYSQVFRGSMLTTSRDSFCILLSWKSLNLKGLMMGNFNLPVKLKME